MNSSLYRSNMAEKHSWLTRSYERMLEGIDNQIDVQDHFWSYLHASRLIWFYFGKWLEENGRNGQAGDVVDCWKQQLEYSEVDTWDLLSQLRTEDVHVRPVFVENIESPELVTHNGEQVTHNGENVVYGKWKYQASYKGREIDVMLLCKNGLDLLANFILEFDSL